MLTKSGLRLGIALPQVFPDGQVDRQLIRDFAIEAEAIGYDDLWLQERIIGPETNVEPLALMAYVAALTQKIRLGVSVMILTQRNPVQLAKALASLDQLSDGRVNAGIGLGRNSDLNPAFGLSKEHRVSRFTESVRVMKALWTLPEVDFDGKYFHLTKATVVPKPAQQPHIPIWFGAQSPAAMRRAALYGDAWMGAGIAALTDTVAHVQEMKASLREVRGNEADFTLSKRIYVLVDEDERRGQERLSDWFGFYYHDRDRGNISGFAGSAAHCVDVLSSMREAGLHHLLLNPVDDLLHQMELLTEKVAPQL